MKIFLIGGASVEKDDPSYANQLETLNPSMVDLGRAIAQAGHDLLVCSPFDGSADVTAARGALETIGSAGQGSCVEFHHPDAAPVVAEMDRFRQEFHSSALKSFLHPMPKDEKGGDLFEYGWLLAQTYAMDRSHSVIALGGKIGKAASLLLGLVDARKKPLLPLTYLGGAAAQAFDRRRYILEDRLGSDLSALHDSNHSEEIVELVVKVSSESLQSPSASKPPKFFISYSRARPCEADFVETALRRRQYDVFRDEKDFAPGAPIPSEIEAAVFAADVFIAIWCNEYACSDWCFDELSLALRRREAGKLTIWLFCLDNTRVVPPGARNLTNYPARSREELERHIMVLLEQKRKI
jgi:hypothetical protein